MMLKRGMGAFASLAGCVLWGCSGAGSGFESLPEDGGTPAERAALPRPSEEVWSAARLLSVVDLEARIARDALLSFARIDARGTRAIAVDTEADQGRRAAAIIALGAMGSVGDRSLLEELASRGPASIRRAAVLGLGEMGSGSAAFLEGIVRGGEGDVAACALVALARSGSQRGRRAVLDVALEEGGRAADASAILILTDWWDSTPRSRSRALPLGEGTVDLLLSLRWSAAEGHGLIQGRRWKDILLDMLLGDDDFLERVIGLAAVNDPEPGVADHVLQAVLHPGSPERLRAAVAILPTTLVRLFEAGVWAPASLEEWRSLLDEIDRRESEVAVESLLRGAVDIPAVRGRAARLLVRAGRPIEPVWIEAELGHPVPDQRIRAAEALADSGSPEWTPSLARLLEDENERVVAVARVALARLGSRVALESAQSVLEGIPSPGRTALVEMIARCADDSSAQELVLGLAGITDPDVSELFYLDLALARSGRLEERGGLRRFLARDPRSPVASIVMQELIRDARREDRLLFRGLFPVGSAHGVDAELGRFLLEDRDPRSLRLLRRVLWSGPWNRSCLAGGLLVRLYGIESLHDELGSPPPGAFESDVRRVGFALGEWGGLTALESATRRLGAEHPATQGAYLGALASRTH